MTHARDIRYGDTIAFEDGSTFTVTSITLDGTERVEFDGYREWPGGNADHIVNHALDDQVTLA